MAPFLICALRHFIGKKDPLSVVVVVKQNEAQTKSSLKVNNRCRNRTTEFLLRSVNLIN